MSVQHKNTGTPFCLRQSLLLLLDYFYNPLASRYSPILEMPVRLEMTTTIGFLFKHAFCVVVVVLYCSNHF